jgi:hypothetical protein
MGGGVREKNDESISSRAMPSRAVLKADIRKRAGKMRMEDVKDARDHDKSKITGSPKVVKFASFPPVRKSLKIKTNDESKNKRVKTAGKKAEANHIKLNFARKNWEEAINPAAALARTKKAKDGAYVSAGEHVPQGEKKAFAEDAANTLFECRDDVNVAESILHSRECTPKASKLLFSNTGSCYYGERNVEKVIAEDRTIYTAVTPTGLCKGIAATSAGPPLTKYSERNDAAKWSEATRALVATACCWAERAFDHSGGAGDEIRSPSTIGATELGDAKLDEASQPSVFVQGRRPIDVLPARVSGASGLTRLSKDAVKSTEDNAVEANNACNGSIGRGDSILLSVWRQNFKKSATMSVSDPPTHFQPQDVSRVYDEDTVLSCNSSASDSSRKTNASRLSDGAIECTLSDLVPSKIDVDASVCSPASTGYDTELSHGLSKVDLKSHDQSAIERTQSADQSDDAVPSEVFDPADATFPDIFNYSCGANRLSSSISSHSKSPPGSSKLKLVTSRSDDSSRMTKVTRQSTGGDSVTEINDATRSVHTLATACARLTETSEKRNDRTNSQLTQEGMDDDSIHSFITRQSNATRTLGTKLSNITEWTKEGMDDDSIHSFITRQSNATEWTLGTKLTNVTEGTRVASYFDKYLHEYLDAFEATRLANSPLLMSNYRRGVNFLAAAMRKGDDDITKTTNDDGSYSSAAPSQFGEATTYSKWNEEELTYATTPTQDFKLAGGPPSKPDWCGHSMFRL